MKSAIYEEWTTNAKQEGLEQGQRQALDRLRNLLTQLATQRFGESVPHAEYVQSIQNQERVSDLILQVSQTNSWNELLQVS